MIYLYPIEIMKCKLLFLLFALPLSILAKEDRIAEDALQRLGETTVLDLDAEALESLKEIADNTEAGLHMHPESAEEKAESQKKVAEAEADTVDDPNEMTQEEADAELASFSDSAAAGMMYKKLKLDMATAVIPTESRRIASPYGIRTYRMHRGTDLGLCQGENRTIVAAFAGKVVKVRNQGRRKGYGKYVILDHGNGLSTLYAHLASWQVNVGDELKAGDTIGVGGNTGRSFGAHLHFEMRYEGIYIDPATVFDFENGTYRSATFEFVPENLLASEDVFQKELSKHRFYKVRSGDCLGKIARKYGISIQRLKQLNNIKGNIIRPGQVLRCS